MEKNRNALTPEEERVIVDKGTERPFTGEYREHKATGTYVCRRCDAPLYRSTDKFDSGCGRPSFDDAIPGRVKRTDDADGMRTEITCATCDAHLGHVFIGEHLTDKNTRHCVNSLSMRFIPEEIKPEQSPIAYFGGGCFWCVEAVMQKLRGVTEVRSGFMGGKREHPSYEQVVTWASGHIEVVKVIYDAKIVSYETLLAVFFASHDPTSLDRQGGDAGQQYHSVIFYANDEQKMDAEQFMKKLTDEQTYDKPIVTELRPVETFWIAEWYHQNYYAQHPDKPYCQIVINPKVQKLREKFADLLKDE